MHFRNHIIIIKKQLLMVYGGNIPPGGGLDLGVLRKGEKSL